MERIVKYIKREDAQEIVKRTNGDYAAAFAEIARLPAADVAEVRHGRWIKYKCFDECSECYAMTILRHNYCPNCGARMDKEDEHEAN